MDRCGMAFEKLEELDTKRENIDLDEFEEFMKKVEEVNKMVRALTSSNKSEIEEATQNAEFWLKNSNREKRNNTTLPGKLNRDPSTIVACDTKINKTVITKNISKKEETEEKNLDRLNCETMSQAAFMKLVEEDAKKRSEDRKQRKEESDVFKAEANKAFSQKDYEKALNLYNKAIEVRKDSWVLYNNRAVTLLMLGLNKRALNDCEAALKLNEKNFKAMLYMAKAYFKMGEEEKAEKWINQAKEMFPGKNVEIEEYQRSWSNDSDFN